MKIIVVSGIWLIHFDIYLNVELKNNNDWKMLQIKNKKIFILLIRLYFQAILKMHLIVNVSTTFDLDIIFFVRFLSFSKLSETGLP